MSVLKRVLEEVHKRRCNLIDMSDEEPELCDVDDWYNEGVDEGKIKAYFDVEQIIRSYMNDIANVNADGWIPVSERLPEEKGWYQCTCSDKEIWGKDIVRDLYYNPEIKQFVDNIRYECNGLTNIENYYWTKYVIAWQPSTEPYKGE